MAGKYRRTPSRSSPSPAPVLSAAGDGMAPYSPCSIGPAVRESVARLQQGLPARLVSSNIPKAAMHSLSGCVVEAQREPAGQSLLTAPAAAQGCQQPAGQEPCPSACISSSWSSVHPPSWMWLGISLNAGKPEREAARRKTTAASGCRKQDVPLPRWSYFSQLQRSRKHWPGLAEAFKAASGVRKGTGHPKHASSSDRSQGSTWGGDKQLGWPKPAK